MIAKLSPFIQDVMDLWPLWAFIGSVIGAWLMWSLKTWLRINVADPIARARTEQAATHHLVQYHLGPNGDTKPLHRRVADIEKANGIDAPPTKDWV